MIIPKLILAAMKPITASKDTRYFLDTVCVRPDGTIEATDGTVALRAKIDLADEQTVYQDKEMPTKGLPPFEGNPAYAVLIPSAVVDKLIRAMPKRSTIPILQAVQLSDHPEGTLPTIAATDLDVPAVATLDTGDRRFPDTARVYARAQQGPQLRVCLAVEILERLCKSAKACGTGRMDTITFYIPTGPEHQGRQRRAGLDHDFVGSWASETCEICGKPRADHEEPDGKLQDPIYLEMGSPSTVTIDGCVMPCKED